MTKEEIIKYNTLIADFMGYEKCKNGKYYIEKFPYSPEEGMSSIYDSCEYSPENMGFDGSWDWLMPVCEHIKAKYDVETIIIKWDSSVSGHYCEIAPDFRNTFDRIQVVSLTQLETVYAAVLSFIMQHNANKIP